MSSHNGAWWLLVLAFLWSNGSTAQAQLTFSLEVDRVVVTNGPLKVVEYVFDDPDIKRPYLTRAHSPSGLLLTRNHPPVAGVDAVDHPTMHPGIWLAWGDINGLDFWRNKARIEHVRFLHEPTIDSGRLQLATENRFLDNDSQPIGSLTSRLSVTTHDSGTIIVWEATITAGDKALTFGDQEEMGFGVRTATGLAEKKGGVITNSQGKTTAAKTWGQPAQWCDYSGHIDGRPCGITVLAMPQNFRTSWWHNRDYGLCVANPFAKAAMKQGPSDPLTVAPSQSLTIAFGAILHDSPSYNPAQAYDTVISSR